TFLILARRAGSLRPAALAGWLYTVARHVAGRAGRASARRPVRLPDGAEDRPAPGRDPLEEVSARELLSILDEELHRLPERERLPLVLCTLDGRSVAEAARLLGTSPG